MEEEKTEQKGALFFISFVPLPRLSTNIRPKTRAQSIAPQLERGDRAAEGGRRGFQKKVARSISLLSSLLFLFSLSPKRESSRARKKRKGKPPPPRPRSPAPAAPPFPRTPAAMMPRYHLTSQIVGAHARGLARPCGGGVKIGERKKSSVDGVEFFFSRRRLRFYRFSIPPQSFHPLAPTANSIPFSRPTRPRKEYSP